MPSLSDILSGLKSGAQTGWKEYAKPGLQWGARSLADLAPAAGTIGGGAYFGPPGAAIGGTLGKGLQSILNKLGGVGWSGTEGQEGAINVPTGQIPEAVAQSALLQQMSTPYQGQFAPIEAEARRRFQEETMPGLQTQFAGGQRSSAFAQAMGGAGAGLESQLAAQKEQFGMQERNIEQARQQALASYLSGQQQIGLGAQELGQRQREMGQRGMLGAGGLGQQAGLLQMQRGLAPVYYQQGASGALPNIMQGLEQGAKAAAYVAPLFI